MTIPFDKTTYISLLADFAPQVINSEAEYDRALAIAERLVASRNLSSEESQFLSLIVTLIEDYEIKHYPMSDVTPHAALWHLIEYSRSPPKFATTGGAARHGRGRRACRKAASESKSGPSLWRPL